MSSSSRIGRRVSTTAGPNRGRRQKARDLGGLTEVDEVGDGRARRLKNAIFNDEIAKLRIREEDLVKVSQEARATGTLASVSAYATTSDDPRPASPSPSPLSTPSTPHSTHRQRVAVRREIPEALRRPSLRRVVLLRRAHPDALRDTEPPKTAGECWGRSGPRLDSRGNVVAHSLLGRPEEFYRIGLLRGHIRHEDVPSAYRCEEDSDGLGHGTQISDNCTGSVKYRWTKDPTFELPALDADAQVAENALASPRVRNREVLRHSSLAMRRLTEQVNQCGMASPMKHQIGSNCSDFEASWRATPPSTAPASGRSVRMSGPQYSFIGGWSYQKDFLLG